ncbi:MAG: TlpA disulfide reductase family protein [Chitinophagaceae bacterium]
MYTKQLLFSLGVIALLFSSCQKGFKIKGTIHEMEEGEIYIIQASEKEKIDTIKVKNNQFTYEGKVADPTVAMLQFGEGQQPAFVILENTNFTLSYHLDSLNSISIQGGEEQNVYNKFIAESKPILTKLDSLGKIAMMSQEDEATIMALQNEVGPIMNTMEVLQKDFATRNGKYVAGAFIAMNYFAEKQDKNVEEMNDVYSHFSDKAKNSYFGKQLNQMIAQLRKTSIGEQAQDFTLNDVNDKPISLSSFKGKYVLVDFWASWCGPCREENPNVVKAYQRYHAKGFEILGVSLDDNKEKWMKAIQKDNLTWIHVSDLKGWQSQAASLYGIESIPSNFLLDKDGKIIAKNLRSDLLLEKLQEILP